MVKVTVNAGPQNTQNPTQTRSSNVNEPEGESYTNYWKIFMFLLSIYLIAIACLMFLMRQMTIYSKNEKIEDTTFSPGFFGTFWLLLPANAFIFHYTVMSHSKIFEKEMYDNRNFRGTGSRRVVVMALNWVGVTASVAMLILGISFTFAFYTDINTRCSDDSLKGEENLGITMMSSRTACEFLKQAYGSYITFLGVAAIPISLLVAVAGTTLKSYVASAEGKRFFRPPRGGATVTNKAAAETAANKAAAETAAKKAAETAAKKAAATQAATSKRPGVQSKPMSVLNTAMAANKAARKMQAARRASVARKTPPPVPTKKGVNQKGVAREASAALKTTRAKPSNVPTISSIQTGIVKGTVKQFEKKSK